MIWCDPFPQRGKTEPSKASTRLPCTQAWPVQRGGCDPTVAAIGAQYVYGRLPRERVGHWVSRDPVPHGTPLALRRLNLRPLHTACVLHLLEDGLFGNPIDEWVLQDVESCSAARSVSRCCNCRKE
jgi:hypothetical protein